MASSSTAEPFPPVDRRRGFRVTRRDIELLAFAGRHRFVLACHVQAWLCVDRSVGYRRLAGLAALGLLAYEQPFHGQPGYFKLTRQGLAVAGSELPVPAVDLGCYRHDAALVWLWLNASSSSAAAGSRLLTEREMRAEDRRQPHEAPRFGLGIYDPRVGRMRRHFADLLLVQSDGRRSALELELTQKASTRLEAILLAYAAQPAIASVTYLTDHAAIAAAVHKRAEALAVSDRVRVQLTNSRISVARPPGPWRACRPQPEEASR